MSGVVDEQVVLLREALTQVVQLGQDLQAGGVAQELHAVAVTVAQDGGHGLGVGDCRFEWLESLVFIVADDKRVIGSERRCRKRQAPDFTGGVGRGGGKVNPSWDDHLEGCLPTRAIDRHEADALLLRSFERHPCLEQAVAIDHFLSTVDRERLEASRGLHLSGKKKRQPRVAGGAGRLHADVPCECHELRLHDLDLRELDLGPRLVAVTAELLKSCPLRLSIRLGANQPFA